MELFSHIHILIVPAHVLIFFGLSIRIIMKRRPVGVALAWLILIFALPFAGAVMYLLVGERHLGKQRVARIAALEFNYGKWRDILPQDAGIDWSKQDRAAASINRLIETASGFPAMAPNHLELIDAAETSLRSIIADIDRARHFCYMEFYIWNEGGTADEVCSALIRAARRGVICRVLVDAIGSSKFLKSKLASDLRKHGIELVAALPVGLLRMIFVRIDLRLHRKIVVIDGEIAYTGSLNLVDPRFFKQEAHVGQWLDAMVRMEGSAVQILEWLFSWDWEVETGQNIKALEKNNDRDPMSHTGTSIVQIVPSGPGQKDDTIHQILLASIYAARDELIMTNPYFVPDESLSTALMSAAKRGVDVTIILPERIDSLLVRFACRSFFDELLASGVRILRYRKGLLHTKSVVIDGLIALFGSVNLDPRSFWLDFEVTLCVYDPDFGTRLRELQQRYASDSESVDLISWQTRSGWERFLENAARLFGPLL